VVLKSSFVRTGMSTVSISLVIRFVRPWRSADSLSANAYGIYLLHYLFVIWIQYGALHWNAPALAKGVAVLVAATGLSWMLAGPLRQSKIMAHVI
jgi:glucans biosynthesis protein C